jgi:transcriptional regulator with XRE-family HTH domain
MAAREKLPDVLDGADVPIGSRIRLRRRAEGRRLTEMARALGYDKGWISQVETNRATASDELLQKIAGYLNLTLRELVEAPVAVIAPVNSPTTIESGGAFGAPAIPRRERSIGQRVDRLIAAAHLSRHEQDLLSDRVVALAREAIALVKATRQ